MGLSTIDKLKLLWNLNKLYNLWEEMSMKEFFGSKKAKGLIIGLITVVMVNVLGLPEEQVVKAIEAVMALVGSYLIAQGAADIGKGKKQAEINDKKETK